MAAVITTTAMVLTKSDEIVYYRSPDGYLRPLVPDRTATRRYPQEGSLRRIWHRETLAGPLARRNGQAA